jgi:tetratricopeptide (TPR) repeat protein
MKSKIKQAISSPKDVSTALQVALQHHLAGRLQQAETIYQQILHEHPHQSDALHLSGEIAYQHGRFESAIDLITHAIQANPAISTYHITLGRVYKDQGEMDQAVACYQNALTLNPNDAISHNGLGNVLFDQGRIEQAIASYKLALSFQPDLAIVHCNLGNALKALSRFDEAAQSYLNTIALKPDHLDACLKLGNLLYSLGKLDDAKASYDLALAIDPDVAETHSNLGNIYQTQGKLKEAVDSYYQALSLKPDFSEACNNLGNALHAQGKLDEAVSSFQQALAINPDYAEAYSNLGISLQAQGKLDEAVSSYQQALSRRDDSAETYFNLGTAWMEQGRLEDAITCYQTAIRLRSDYIKAYCNLGVALKQQKKIDDALDCYQTAVAIAPDCVDALFNTGVIYGLKRQFKLAEEWYRKTLDIDPDYVAAHVNLSSILLDEKRLDEAQQHRDLAYRKQCLFVTHSHTATRTVLLLVDAGKANVPFGLLFPAQHNNLIEWMIEYATPDQRQQLPAYDVVFNAIGSPEQTDTTAQPVTDFLAVCGKPVLNHPEAVKRTARHLAPTLFGDVQGLVIPEVWRVEQTDHWYANPDFRFPALARPLASHGGEGVFLVAGAAQLAEVPLDRSGRIYLCTYHDFRSDDGYFRKYRIIFVDRKPYPYHLAISEQWMVHYETANMLDPAVAWKLQEEKGFLEDPGSVLGNQGMAAMEAIGRLLDLDFAGVDFSILPDGKILLFEANATMLVHPEEDHDALKFKNPYVQNIFDAFGTLISRTTQRET